MSPQPSQQPNYQTNSPRLAQYRALASRNPQGGMTPGPAMPQGGAPMGAPNYRGMGAPPNQAPMQQAQMGQRMAAPWMNQGQATPMQGQQPAPPQPQQPNDRMPAPWMRPQPQGLGNGPAARMQSQGPQQPGSPMSQRNNQ